MKIFAGAIYKAKRGKINDKAMPRYNCFIPEHTFEKDEFDIVDCWPCDKEGNIHPGYNYSAIPVSPNDLGEMIDRGDGYDD